MPGGLCARDALGWTLGGPAYWDNLWGFYLQFLPPDLEEQYHALLVPSVHISGSKLLHMQKVGQVLPELVASPGPLDDGGSLVLSAKQLFPASFSLDYLQPQLHGKKVHVHTLPREGTSCWVSLLRNLSVLRQGGCPRLPDS